MTDSENIVQKGVKKSLFLHIHKLEVKLHQCDADKAELVEAIKKAMNIVELWSPIPTMERIQEQHIGEFAALAMMRQAFEQLLAKHAGAGNINQTK